MGLESNDRHAFVSGSEDMRGEERWVLARESDCFVVRRSEILAEDDGSYASLRQEPRQTAADCVSRGPSAAGGAVSMD